VAGARTYPQPIIRCVNPSALALLSEEDADRGEEDGLEGNHLYRDLRGLDWDQVDGALHQEAALFTRLSAAADLDEEAERIEAEREEGDDPEDDLYGLDVGVIAATFALSALGATPVSSCNAGGFGGRHVAVFPHVAFYLPRTLATALLALAEEADVGVDVVEGGIARLYGLTDYDLHRFARVALDRHRDTA
jgi:hypothetical protein